MLSLALSSIPDEAIARFWARVDRSGGTDACWPWLAYRNVQGYGLLTFKGRDHLAHRVAYALAHGTVPAKMLVCHRCDVTRCVNPSHLFLGTHADNAKDRVEKDRSATAAKGNHGTHRFPDRVPRGDRNGMRLHPERIRRGADNANAKLSEQQVKDARFAMSNGVTCRAVASRLGISESGARAIKSGRTWRHLSVIALLILVALVGAVDRSEAQVINPTGVEFDVSADHNTVVLGVPAVTKYELRIFLSATSPTPVSTFDLGKPAPVGTKASVTNVAMFTPLQTGGYVARVVAIGPGGEGVSDPTDPFGKMGAPAKPTAPGVIR